MGKIKIECDECEKIYSKTKELKVDKVSEGYLKLKCSGCDEVIESLSYPID